MPHNNIIVKFGLSKLRKEIKQIFASTFFRTIAYSLVQVFVPAYLYSLGYSLSFSLAFMGAFYGSLIFFGPFITYLMSVYGSKKIFLFNPTFSVAYLMLLYFIKFRPVSNYTILIALIGGVATMLFWMPTNSHFAKLHNYKRSAKETGLWVAISHLASSIGPFLGGLIILYLGFGILYAIAVGVLFFSIVPMLFIEDYKEQITYKWREVFSKKNRPMFDEFFVQGFISWSLIVLFPFYVFLQQKSFIMAGASAGLIGLGIVLFIGLFGNFADRFGKHKTLRLGAILSAVAWMFAYSAESTMQLYLVSIFLGIAWVLIDIPIFAIFCNHLEPNSRNGFMAFREIALSAGRAAVPIVAILLPVAWGLNSIFLVCVFASLFFLFNGFYEQKIKIIQT